METRPVLDPEHAQGRQLYLKVGGGLPGTRVFGITRAVLMDSNTRRRSTSSSARGVTTNMYQLRQRSWCVFEAECNQVSSRSVYTSLEVKSTHASRSYTRVGAYCR